MTDREYERMAKRLEYNVATRISLLTFSFTTVLAALGLAFTIKVNRVSCLVFLVPYFLIIPFSARIAYYRIVYARMYSFMKVFAPGDMKFAICGEEVPEDAYPQFTCINILNNYELFLLACASAVTFYSKYPTNLNEFVAGDWIICAIPIVLTLFVGWINHYAYDYKKWERLYQEKWEKQRYPIVTNTSSNV